MISAIITWFQNWRWVGSLEPKNCGTLELQVKPCPHSPCSRHTILKIQRYASWWTFTLETCMYHSLEISQKQLLMWLTTTSGQFSPDIFVCPSFSNLTHHGIPKSWFKIWVAQMAPKFGQSFQQHWTTKLCTLGLRRVNSLTLGSN